MGVCQLVRRKAYGEVKCAARRTPHAVRNAPYALHRTPFKAFTRFLLPIFEYNIAHHEPPSY